MSEHAFQWPHRQQARQQDCPSLTKREWIATQVAPALFKGMTGLDQASPEERIHAFSQIAGYLFEIADAMLAQSAKGEGK